MSIKSKTGFSGKLLYINKVEMDSRAEISINKFYQGMITLYRVSRDIVNLVREEINQYLVIELEEGEMITAVGLNFKSASGGMDNCFKLELQADILFKGERAYTNTSKFQEIRFEITEGNELIGLCPYDMNKNYMDILFYHKIDIPINIENKVVQLVPAAFLGHIVESVLAESSVSTFIYKPAQPISTVRRHLIIIPELAEKEIGFNQIIFRLRNVTQNTGAATVFYGSEATLNALKKLLAKKSGEASYIEFNDWDDFLIVFRDIKPDDTMWIILSRKEGLSYAPAMARIPKYLNKYFQANSFVLAYPVQAGMNEGTRYLT